MASGIRKLFIDSRINTVGTPNDFTIQLPQMFPTTNTQALVLGQFSITNVFQSIMRDYNDILFLQIAGAQQAATIAAGVNDKLYYVATTDAFQNPFYEYEIVTLNPGTYTPQTFAAELQRVLQVRYPRVTVTTDSNGKLVYNGYSPDYSIYIRVPPLQDIVSTVWQADQWKGAAYDPFNSHSLNGCFTNATDTMQRSYTWTLQLPSTGQLYNAGVRLAPGQYDGPGFAAALQTALTNIAGLTTSATDPPLACRCP